MSTTTVMRSLDKQTRKRLDDAIEKNIDYLVRFARFRVNDRDEAEDIVHDAILSVLEHDVSKMDAQSLRMYMFRSVYNRCQDHYRKRMPTVSIEGLNTLPDTDDEQDDIEADIARIESLLGLLSGKEAEVIRMKVIDGLSFVEISDILATPPSTLKSRFKTGMSNLKKMYFSKE